MCFTSWKSYYAYGNFIHLYKYTRILYNIHNELLFRTLYESRLNPMDPWIHFTMHETTNFSSRHFIFRHSYLRINSYRVVFCIYLKFINKKKSHNL